MATPDSTALIGAPGPPIVSMTSARGVPISNSATPARRPPPVTVQTIVPGDCSVPTWRNQAAPLARMPGTLARVSALFTSVGAAGVRPPGVAITEPAAETGSRPTSSTPWR